MHHTKPPVYVKRREAREQAKDSQKQQNHTLTLNQKTVIRHGSIPRADGYLRWEREYALHEREATRQEKESNARKEERARDEEQRALDRQNRDQQQAQFEKMMAQAQGARQRTPPPPSPPRLSLHKFVEGTDNMAAFLDTFEATATASEWPVAQWSIHLRGSLAGAGLQAVSALPADQQVDYDRAKQVLRSVYKISTETYRKRVFGQTFNPSNPEQWLREYRQSYDQWLDSKPGGVPERWFSWSWF